MTLDSFVAETASDLGRFWTEWKEKQGEAAESIYPLDLPPGEWFEQFLLFLNREAE